jgi:hypothetical protein
VTTKKIILNREQKIKRYSKKNKLSIVSEDYEEISQSLYYLGKAIYNFLQMKNKRFIEKIQNRR